jgi:hypothetical protein
MQAPDSERPAEAREVSTLGPLFCRLTWFILGPVALLGLTYAIATRGGGWVTLLDLSFVLVGGLVIGARWMELRSGTATTATGEPATAAQVRRYSQVLALLAAGVWAA